jgi:cytochrome c-type biogenesis protein CcmE
LTFLSAKLRLRQSYKKDIFMRRRDRRLLLICSAGVLLLGSSIVASLALKDTASFFYAPADVAAKQPKPGTQARVGGLVAKGTVVRGENGMVNFVVTDGAANLRVSYRGVLPDLFREGQGVIAEGKFKSGEQFEARTILARHDENYMPKEVADSLKKSGQWREAPLPAKLTSGEPNRAAGTSYP